MLRSLDMSFDKNQLSIPWIESPFFYSLIDTFDLTEKEREMCIQYYEKGSKPTCLPLRPPSKFPDGNLY